ncbi:MAG: signal recognition particle-docking protein FtsY [Porticoccaceae bacterium]|nr:signal recognition particle-docking protein FtsY [Porticoccaceae bacterium]
MTDDQHSRDPSEDRKAGFLARFRRNKPEQDAGQSPHSDKTATPATPHPGQSPDSSDAPKPHETRTSPSGLRRLFSRNASEPGDTRTGQPANSAGPAPETVADTAVAPDDTVGSGKPAPEAPEKLIGENQPAATPEDSAPDTSGPAPNQEPSHGKSHGATSPDAGEGNEAKSGVRRLLTFGKKERGAESTETESPKTAGETVKAKPAGRIRRALARTREGMGNVFLGKKAIDDDLLEHLETQLLSADLGMEVTLEVINALTERVRRKELNDVAALQKALHGILVDILKSCEKPLEISGPGPFVLMVVGVNGVGKTTTIGKLAHRYLDNHQSVMLAAGDTFRAAAVEQLQAWGERNRVPVVAQHTGADSASVIYDAVESARARGTDILIADTAGRLHTKSNLMEELKKIRRVVGKLDASAPHEVLLVLDAGTGQNAVSQMQQFHKDIGVTGIALTKLDGTAKGGIIFALCKRFGVPVRYVGVGEGVEDLQPFKAEDFVSALLDLPA